MKLVSNITTAWCSTYIVTTMFVCYSKQFGMLKLDDILQKIHIFAKVKKKVPLNLMLKEKKYFRFYVNFPVRGRG